jgi:imidazolonepropionase-like amidohydrolase
MELAAEVGIDTVEHGNWLDDKWGDGYDRRTADRLAEASVVVSATLVGLDFEMLDRADREPAASDDWDWIHEGRYRWIRDMVGAGVQVMVTTDAGGAVETPHGSLPLAARAYVELVGMTPMQAIQATTWLPAQALGLEEAIGAVEVGKRADLLIVEGDPVQDIAVLQQVRWVIQDGQVVVDGGLCLQ